MTTPPSVSRAPCPHKFDHEGLYRAEIEERTRNGETCKEIADTLVARGVKVSDKTVSRKRLQWGLRQRTEPSTKGTKRPRLAAERPEWRRLTGKDPADYNRRRSEITERTRRGESAEDIVLALQAQGFELKKGVSTVTRLQSFWKLIPPDPDRAEGKGKYSKKRKPPSQPRQKQPSAQQQEGEEQSPAGQVLHYPGNCSFGPPKRRGEAVGPNEEITLDDGPASDMDSDSGMVMPQFEDFEAAEIPSRMSVPPPQQDPLVLAADLMSADILVDLANSTLVAAIKFKDVFSACYAQKPAPGSLSSLPPTVQDIVAAKMKVREAATVVLDLTSDSPDSSGG